jgi:hypothetical protein
MTIALVELLGVLSIAVVLVLDVHLWRWLGYA